MEEAKTGSNYPLARWDFGCRGTGAAGTDLADLNPVDSAGNHYQCFFSNRNDGTNHFYFLCGYSKADVDKCAVPFNNQLGVPAGWTVTVPLLRYQGR